MADYNINAVTRRIVYTGSAGVGPYAFSFEILVNTDVDVYFNTTLLTLATDYTVTINANGTGSVTLIVGSSISSTPTLNDRITIVGARDIERTTDFVTAGELRASALNEQLDALTIFDQQLLELSDRAVRAPVTDPVSVNMELPNQTARADKILKFDSNGNVAVESVSVLTGAGVVGANFTNNVFTGTGAQTAFTLTVAPGSKNNAQVYIDGVYQLKSSFSVSSTTLTFTEAPPLNAQIEVVIGKAIDTLDADSGNINYNQGGTGAQTRSVESKLQEFVSVKDFGAVGDGVTNDAAAFNAALSASNTVIVPHGEYRIGSTVTVNANQRLLGIGMPKLTSPATITVIHMAGGVSELRNFSIECDGSDSTAPSNTASVAVKIAHPTSIPSNPLASWTGIEDGIVDNLIINRYYYAIQMDVTYEWTLRSITASRYQYGIALNRVKYDTYGTGGGKVINNIHMSNLRLVGTYTSYAVPSGMIGLDCTDVFNTTLDGFSAARNEVNVRCLNVRGTFTAGYMEGYSGGSPYTNTYNMTFTGCSVSLDTMWVEDTHTSFSEAFYVAYGSIDIRGGNIKLDASASVITNATDSTATILRMPELSGVTTISSDLTKVITSLGDGQLYASKSAIYAPAATACGLIFGTGTVIYPAGETGTTSNGDTDLGSGGVQFQDIYLVNAPTVSSDRNKKRDIRVLSDAEQNVAVAAKGLLRAYRLNSAYEKKGEDARIHFGIIAQELQAAFEAEGLDPWRYGVLIKNIDPETNSEILAVRYEELLAFIISAI